MPLLLYLVGCLYYLYFIIFFLKIAKQSQFIPVQNVVYFITLSFLVRKIFTFYINDVLLFKCPVPGSKGQCVSNLRVLLTRRNTKIFIFKNLHSLEKKAVQSKAFKISLGAFDPLLTKCAIHLTYPLLTKCVMHLTYPFKVSASSLDLLVKSSGFQAGRRRRIIASGCRIDATSQKT